MVSSTFRNYTTQGSCRQSNVMILYCLDLEIQMLSQSQILSGFVVPLTSNLSLRQLQGQENQISAKTASIWYYFFHLSNGENDHEQNRPKQLLQYFHCYTP